MRLSTTDRASFIVRSQAAGMNKKTGPRAGISEPVKPMTTWDIWQELLS
jgi:hypothetical protein